MSFKKEIVDLELGLNNDEKSYLFIAKSYINHLDLGYFEEVIDDIEEETDVMNEDSLLEAHHQLVADILRYINKEIFKGNIEYTLLWMEKELNYETWDAFSCMTF